MKLDKKYLTLAKRVLTVAIIALLLEISLPQYVVAAEIRDNYATGPSLYSLEAENSGSSRVNVLPENSDDAPRMVRYITATAYSSTVDQCDDTPFLTANGSFVRDGIIAANFLPFGTKVKIPELFGDKVFTVEDRMNSKYHYRIDIWMTNRQAAKDFGNRYVKIEVF